MRDIVDKVYFLKGISNIDGKLITYNSSRWFQSALSEL